MNKSLQGLLSKAKIFGSRVPAALCSCRFDSAISLLYEGRRHIRQTTSAVFTGPDSVQNPRLTPLQVTSILCVNELEANINEGAVKWFESNQLQSNNPIEDRRVAAKFSKSSRFLFGVFDGHAGCACAQAVSERLFYYIALMLAAADDLDRVVKMLKERDVSIHALDLLTWYRGEHDYINRDLGVMYSKSMLKLCQEILALWTEESTAEENLSSAFMRLDQDIVTEALPNPSDTSVNLESLHVAFSGTCCCVVFVDGVDLYIANTGDSKAVLGINLEGDQWEAKDLSHEHNADNIVEVQRLQNSHPNEGANVIRNGRLLGDLAPLRAFGDVRYKWPTKDLKHILKTLASTKMLVTPYGNNLIPANYQTPPYLTAEPEIIHHRLTPKDKFVVLATDGLWDMLTPEKVVKLIGGHLDGKQVHVNFRLPHDAISLSEINQVLLRRKTSLANKAVDSNAATHLIRNALGPEHGRVSAMLTLPMHISRLYRDDISVTVIFFDTDYVRDHFHHE